MNTYKQDIKEEARNRIWSHAIDSLTKKREQSKVLNHEYIKKLWDYSFNDYLIPYGFTNSVDNNVLEKWLEFSDSIYGYKEVKDIKIAYLCGPEPENDLNILLKLGVRIENIWAVEKQENLFQQALNEAGNKFPNLKIYQGSFDEFLNINRIPFDIIYLDFTASIFSNSKKPFVTVHKVFEEQALSDLGILITNFSEPENNDDTINFLSSYFMDQEYVESGVVKSIKSKEENKEWFVEGPVYSGYDYTKFKEIVKLNLDSVYSAFCSHYIISYANIIAPAFRSIKNQSVRKKLFKQNEGLYKNITQIMLDTSSYLIQDYKEFGYLDGELVINSNDYPLWNFIERLSTRSDKLSQYWKHIFSTTEGGFSRYDAIKFRDLLRNYHIGEEFLSDFLQEAIPEINKIVNFTRRVFCDVPLPFLWIELAINQLGSPYHSQFKNHLRFSYTAQRNKMFVDCFTFDKCRSLYDWLPMIELYGKDLSVLERQMLTRICLDVIGGKQSRTILPNLYYGSNLIGIGERDWVKFVDRLPKRDNMSC